MKTAVTVLERNVIITDETGRWPATRCHLSHGEIDAPFDMDQRLVQALGEDACITRYLDNFRKAGLPI